MKIESTKFDGWNCLGHGGNAKNKFSGNARIYGLIGNPVKGSLSPEIHNDIFRLLHHDALYVPILVKNNLSAVLDACSILNICGLSVTSPCKEECLRYVVKTTEFVRKCRSANTLSLLSGKWFAVNVDGEGARNVLCRRSSFVSGSMAFVFGYGPMARSMILDWAEHLLFDCIIFVGRDKMKVEQWNKYFSSFDLPTKIEGYALQDESQWLSLLRVSDVVASTFQEGFLAKDILFKIQSSIREDGVFLEVVYGENRPVTKRSLFAKKNWNIVFGEEILLEQALLQQKHWENINLDEKEKSIFRLKGRKTLKKILAIQGFEPRTDGL